MLPRGRTGWGTGNRNGQRPAPRMGAGVYEPAPIWGAGEYLILILPDVGPDVGAIDDSSEILRENSN